MRLASSRQRIIASYYKRLASTGTLALLELLQQYWAYVALKWKNDIMSWGTNIV
jgi:hypothetical protein